MEPVRATKWKTKRPDKSLFATKRTTKLKNEDGSEIIKQEWVVTDCEKQDELEDNHTKKQRQKNKEIQFVPQERCCNVYCIVRPTSSQNYHYC